MLIWCGPFVPYMVHMIKHLYLLYTLASILIPYPSLKMSLLTNFKGCITPIWPIVFTYLLFTYMCLCVCACVCVCECACVYVECVCVFSLDLSPVKTLEHSQVEQKKYTSQNNNFRVGFKTREYIYMSTH